MFEEEALKIIEETGDTLSADELLQRVLGRLKRRVGLEREMELREAVVQEEMLKKILKAIRQHFVLRDGKVYPPGTTFAEDGKPILPPGYDDPPK
jgi:hypothetical protein